MQGIDFGPDLKVRLPDRFNVAVPFVDRHVGEGRGSKVVIRTVHGETVTFAELAELPKASAALEARLAAPTDDCFWLYSSGSTGRPKGAVHLQRDMVVTSEFYGVRALGVTENDIGYSVGKLYFAYGLGNAMTF